MNEESGVAGDRMADQGARMEVERHLPNLERHLNVVRFDQQRAVVVGERVALDAVFLHQSPEVAG